MADPDQILDNLRAAGKDWYAAAAGSAEERAAADRIVMEFRALDVHLSCGGPMPGAWLPAGAVHGAMKDASFPVVPPGQIDAEVAADVHRLGLDRKPGLAQR